MNGSPQRHSDPRSHSRREGRARGGLLSDARREARRQAQARAGRVRLLVLALAIVVLTWLPGSVGSSIGLPFLGAWGVFSGYTGLSWVLPALLLGLSASGAWRDHGLPLHRPVGVAVGVSAAFGFLILAAQLVGG